MIVMWQIIKFMFGIGLVVSVFKADHPDLISIFICFLAFVWGLNLAVTSAARFLQDVTSPRDRDLY